MSIHKKFFTHFLLSLLIWAFNSGCSEKEPESSPQTAQAEAQKVEAKELKISNKELRGNSPARSMKNWEQIKASGKLRLGKLVWEEENQLPRAGTSSLFHFDLVQSFAKEHYLAIDWISADNLGELLALLENNEIDIIPRHLTVTDSRKEKFDFTSPLANGKEVLITATSNQSSIDSKNIIESDLMLFLPEKSSYLDTVSQNYPSWKISKFTEALDSDELADKVASKEFQFSIIDQVQYRSLREYRSDIISILQLPQNKLYAWALAKGNIELKDKLNQFVALHHIEKTSNESRTYDLDKIKHSGRSLRMITRNSPETYFLWKGELMGFEYELAREFAKQNGLRLSVIVAETYQEMLDMLEQGKGDFIAAGISRTEERKKSLNFSFRYNRVSEKIVAHKNSPPLKRLDDLKGRTISVRQSSAFWSTAVSLREKYGVKVEAADELLSTELLIDQVARKSIDLTIADSNLISIEESFREEINSPLTLKEDIPYAYIVRKNNPLLLNSLNTFIKKEYRNTFYNVVKNKYFSNDKRKQKYREKRITDGSALSPYDSLVKEKTKPYGFDWRLITSQMYQESRFNPEAKSGAGALGLMQVLPRTAKELGYQNLFDPKEAIAAGVDYLNWTRLRFSDELPLQERILFALAAYNAGYGHVKDAQRLAREKGWRDDKWFNHVEKAMLLLQRPEYYKKARFGYCRGSEPVQYVREINQRYLSYLNIM
ncbi:transporter substrate-binding domain-containing protein [Aliikangiella sp. G2MR2-5]|uniref:transporter substrate-binding domain-containing protein n=1 Tax=Aliikangiella sp. G2MR2-5 TaxID=2788943 RepID=UPI0018A92D64|nr:transporter substrate-binding domain-containing protein [Aliikangiella sp. G2MR2-5]